MDLTSLSVKELENLRNEIDFLLQQKKIKRNYGDYDLFLESLNKILTAKLRIKPVLLNVMKTKNKALFSRLVLVTEYLNTFLLTSGTKCDKINKLKLYILYSELMTEYLTSLNISLSLNTLINFYESFPSVLESNYPDYLAQGLLYLVLK